jgi:hypothetical protein
LARPLASAPLFHDAVTSIDALVARADAALYRASTMAAIACTRPIMTPRMNAPG